jgi:hypothetical protein
MGQRTRKFIGTVLTVGFLIVYSLVAMAIGAEWATTLPGLPRFAFFAVAGLLWLPPVMLIVRWMAQP